MERLTKRSRKIIIISLTVCGLYLVLSSYYRTDADVNFHKKTVADVPAVRQTVLSTYHQQQELTSISTTVYKRSSMFNASTSKFKVILMWNQFRSFLADNPLPNVQCPVKNCLFTPDLSLLNQSDVVVLYMDTLIDFPLNRHPHQRFVFFHLESPFNSNKMLTKVNKDDRLRYGYFNWTMTYRSDSDIIQREDYGYIVPKIMGTRKGTLTNNWVGPIDSNRTKYSLGNKLAGSFTLSEGHPMKDLIRKKTKLVAWFVGHCSTPIRREEYVKQLSQYIYVDIFGKCNKRSCPYDCDEMLRANYKFYLAFENSWCQDYVTEKFYRTLKNDAVPVALGGADYEKFAPPNSYINAKDFGSPKELADYLMMLDKSDEMYARYFDWKKNYDIIFPDMYGFCQLCQMAHDNSLPPKVYRDISQWWMNAGDCKRDWNKYL